MKRVSIVLLIISFILGNTASICMARTYPNENLDISNRPEDNTRIDEFIALVSHISYWSEGDDAPYDTDKTGAQPSDWTAPYVQSEINKGVIKPNEIVYSSPATIAFAAKYLSNSKGLYSWDYENIYDVAGTENLTAEDKMYLNVAFDYGLIDYYSGINASTVIKRKDVANMLLDKPLKTLEHKALSYDNSMKNLHVFFENNYTKMDYQFNLIKKYKDVITHVSFFGVKDTDGVIKIDFDKPEQLEAIKYCNDNGIVTFLVVDNYNFFTQEEGAYSVYDEDMAYKMITDDADATISQIMKSVEKYDMDGVNVTFDIYNGGAYRDKYVQFMKKLSSKLKAENKLLMTSVGAYLKEEEENSGFYDYSGLSDVCDYIHIILYDENSANAYNDGKITQPGCNSNIVYINRVLKYAYYKIQPEKILLGTQSYAIKFGSTAENIDFDASWLSSPNLVYNEEEASGHITNSDGTIYFETEEGMNQRLLQAYKFNLSGMSSFSLTCEFPPIFTLMNSASSMRTEIITSMRNNLVPEQYYNYYSNGIKRDEFCDFIVKFIEAKSGKTIDEYLKEKNITVTKGKFTDTDNYNVYVVNALGIVNGRTDSTFGLEVITRQEAATILKNLAELFEYKNTSQKIDFNDTDTLAQWAKDGIDYISAIQDKTNSRNVMSGVGNGNFAPFGEFTRAQTMMAMIRLYNAI